MKNAGNQPSNDDVLDIRIRFFRRESPKLFRAFEQFADVPATGLEAVLSASCWR